MRSMIFLMTLLCATAVAADSAELKDLFDADQASRSEAVLASGIVPSLQEEKDRRVAVLRLLAQGRVKTADDYFHALIVLHHTPIWEDENGKVTSFSGENHILAFFLAGRAYELGHKAGLHFLAWTYNYYLRGAGCSMEKYGYDATNGYVKARDDNISAEQRLGDCGFDPQPHFVRLKVLGPTQPKGGEVVEPSG